MSTQENNSEYPKLVDAQSGNVFADINKTRVFGKQIRIRFEKELEKFVEISEDEAKEILWKNFDRRATLQQ